MERLTIPDVRVDAHTTRRSFIDVSAVREHAMEFYCRLKAYEDTGLTPERVYEMYGEYCLLESALKSYGSHKRMKELAEADKDGRLVVLPCKVGDTVFALLDDMGKRVVECEVKQIGLGNNIGFAGIAQKGSNAREYGVALKGFGKTVFLAREEAERAMEGGKDGD